MKKFLSITIIAIIALIGLTVVVNAAAVTTQEEFMTAVDSNVKFSIEKDLTIKLEENITITNEVTIGTWGSKSNTVTLDLNGYTIKLDGSSAHFYVQNTGTLIIKDSADGGKITNEGATNSKTYNVYVKGNCQIDGGTIENTIASKQALYINGDTKQANCIMNGGTIKNTWDKSGRAVVIGGKGIFTMNGGKIENKAPGGDGLVPAIQGGEVVITGGTIESAGTGIQSSSTNVKITGGTIKADNYGLQTLYAIIEPAEGKEVNVSAGKSVFRLNTAISADKGNQIMGGNFDAPELKTGSQSNVEVYGGSFNIDVSEFMDEDSVQIDDENGNKIVVVPVELDTPTNLKWDGTKATWDAVPNATSYVVIVSDEHGQITEDITVEDTSIDLVEYLTDENKEYIFVVIADSDTPRYLASTGAESEIYVFPVEDNKEDVTEEQPGEDIKDEEMTEEGTAEQEPEKDEKDETPTTGSVDIVLLVSSMIAVVSVAGIVKVRRYI